MQDLSQMSTEDLLRMRRAAQQQPAPQPSAPRGPVFGPAPPPPDPLQQNAEQRAAEDQAREAEKFVDDKGARLFEQTTKLRTEFNNFDFVKDYPTVMRQYSFALQTQPTPSGDQALITSYAKMLDPGSVVREQEFDTTAQADSALGRTISRIQRELGMDGGGRLSEAARQKVREEMRTLAKQYDAQYQQTRARYGELAQSYGFDPNLVLGDDYSQTYADTINAFWEDQAPAQAPENRDNASAAMFDPTIPPEKSYGDDGSGNPLLVMQNGKLFGLSRGTFGDDNRADYVELGGEFDDIITGEAKDLYDRINETEQSLRERRGEGGFKEVAGRGITLGLSDEAAGIGQAIGSALSGDFNLGANFEAGRAVEDLRIEQGRENLGMAATGLELLSAGGAIRAASGFGQARQAVQSLRNSGQAVNRASVQGAMRNRATVEGAGIGAVAGAAEGSTLQERGQNALVGAGAGGVLGRVGQNVQNALANRAVTQSSAALPSGAQAQQAADNLGIDLIPAVTGGTTAQRLTSGARQGFISDRPIASAVDRMETQGVAARTRASEMAGDAVDAEDAGELVRRGAQVYSQRTSQIGGNLYDRADRMAGGVKLPLPKATQALDDEIASLQQSPTAGSSSLLRDLQNLRNQISQGQFSIPGIRAMRTDLRQEIVARGLRFSPSDAIYSRVLRAAEDDLIGGLRQAGKDNAANALQTASNFWRRRVETIDEVLDPILGKNAPRSGEQILAAVERLAKPDSGSSVNLGRLMRAMPAGEASAVRATVINRLGRPTAGAAEVDREGFSFATFLTNWNNMSPRARSALFPRESREALDQLATVAQRVKAAGASTNTSNTAGALLSQGAISGGLWYLDPFVAAFGAGSQYAFGKLLASPRFARLLAGAPRQDNPQARRAFASRLGNLAQSEPTIAREIAAYQRAIVANDNVAGSLAAEEQQDIPQ